MKKKAQLNLLSLFIILSSLFVNNSARSDQKPEPPRSFGPLVLGMSVEVFKAITGADPVRGVMCQEGELVALLYSTKEKAERFRGTYFVSRVATLKYQPPYLSPETIICSFYKGKLYSIEMSGIRGNSQSVKARYESALGKPSWHDGDGMDSLALRWDTSATRLQFIYSAVPADNAYMQIEYYDLDIMKQIPRRPEIK